MENEETEQGIVLDASLIQVQQKYTGGIHLSNGAERMYEYLITTTQEGGQFFKETILSSTWTPKRNHKWGKGETTYFYKEAKDTIYKSLLEALKARWNLTNIPA
jgi:hypothetical protein